MISHQPRFVHSLDMIDWLMSQDESLQKCPYRLVSSRESRSQKRRSINSSNITSLSKSDFKQGGRLKKIQIGENVKRSKFDLNASRTMTFNNCLIFLKFVIVLQLCFLCVSLFEMLTFAAQAISLKFQASMQSVDEIQSKLGWRKQACKKYVDKLAAAGLTAGCTGSCTLAPVCTGLTAVLRFFRSHLLFVLLRLIAKSKKSVLNRGVFLAAVRYRTQIKSILKWHKIRLN